MIAPNCFLLHILLNVRQMSFIVKWSALAFSSLSQKQYVDQVSLSYSNLTRFIKSHEVHLRSRLYRTLSSLPCYVSVVTRQMSPFSLHSRLPFPENHLGGLQLQPYVHNCIATIREGHRTHRFMVFYKRHCHLLANQCLVNMVQGDATTIQGDVIIMRLGSKASYVNLRTGDSKRTDWLMRR